MAVRMMSGLPARVAQVLKDYLPAELDLIDIEEADSITTPDIESASYYEWDQKLIQRYPACSIRTASSSALVNQDGSPQVYPLTFGSAIRARHRLDVRFHLTIGQANANPLTLQKFMQRYVAGAMRVLCIMHPTLTTVADPVDFVSDVLWVGDAVYGPEEEQDDGALVRTATLPIEIIRSEVR